MRESKMSSMWLIITVLMLILGSSLLSYQNGGNAATTTTQANALQELRLQSERSTEPVRFSYILNSQGFVSHLTGNLASINSVSFAGATRTFFEENSHLFGVQDMETEFAIIDQNVDSHGAMHLSYQQVHQNLPVLSHILKAHADKYGRLIAVSLKYQGGLDLSTIATLSKDNIIEIARDEIGNQKAHNKEPFLAVFIQHQIPVLVYSIDISGGFANNRRYLINANTGQLEKEYTLDFSEDAIGNGRNLLGENVDSLFISQGTEFMTPEFLEMIEEQDEYLGQPPHIPETGEFNMVDMSNPDRGFIYTLTAYNAPFYPANIVYSDTETFDSEVSSQSHQSGVSAHDYLHKTSEFLENHFQRAGWHSAGDRIVAIIDYGPNELISEYNAFYDNYVNVVCFGIGGELWGGYRPFSAGQDVVSHEIMHGITYAESGLIYENQSGALNESLSDVFGYLVEAEYQDGGDWLVAEDISLSGYFRNMADPPARNDPDHIDSPFYVPFTENPTDDNDMGGVHSNSGIPNKVFYLMVSGGTHYEYEIDPLSMDIDESREIAAQIWYAWVNDFLTPEDNFITGREKMLQVCETLFPDSDTYFPTVHTAWQSTGVGLDFAFTASPSYISPDGGLIDIWGEIPDSDDESEVIAQIRNIDSDSLISLPLSYDPMIPEYWEGSFELNVEEGMFKIDLSIQMDSSGYILPVNGVARFSTAGPLSCDAIEIGAPEDGSPSPGDYVRFTLDITNQGSSYTLPNAYAQIIVDTDYFELVGDGLQYVYDLLPGETRAMDNYIRFNILENCPFDTTFIFDIIMGSDMYDYWEDTLAFHVYNPTVFVDQNSLIPSTYELHQNFPNPFNPGTTIRYELPQQSDVRISVYDVLGQEVTTLVSENQTAGYKSAHWNGKNNHGQQVSAGMYLYVIDAGEFIKTRKMVLLK